MKIPAPEKSRQDSFRFGVRPVEREKWRGGEREEKERGKVGKRNSEIVCLFCEKKMLKQIKGK